jgi:large subunit ribosomal protein L15
MKLHDLRPAPGAHKKKTRVGRGIAAGQGKTAGRGTKGQKARAGGTIPAWFEGGQTPLHQRIPKLRGFKNPFKIDYEVVNVGDIARLVELGILEAGDMPGAKKAKSTAPITVNQEILRAAGLVRTLNKPLKVLGNGELSTALFVVADGVSGSARAKIEAAGGSVSILEVPKGPKAALGLDLDVPAGPDEAPAAKAPAAAAPADDVPADDAAGGAEAEAPAKASRPKAPRKTKAATADADEAPATPAESEAAPAPEAVQADETADA